MTNLELIPLLRFKTERIKNEWTADELDKRFTAIIMLILAYNLKEANKLDKPCIFVKITDICRTQNEQDAIYAKNEKYKQTKWKSVHQYWRGIDIICELQDGTNMSEEWHKDLMNWLNSTVKYCKSCSHNTALYHDVGHGGHLHLQVYWENETRLV